MVHKQAPAINNIPYVPVTKVKNILSNLSQPPSLNFFISYKKMKFEFKNLYFNHETRIYNKDGKRIR